MYEPTLPPGPGDDLEATLPPQGDRTHQLQQRLENSLGVLTVEAGVGLGGCFPLGRGATLLGRSPECDIHIPDRDVSRQHLRIERDDLGNYQVRDLDSTNGTRVGGDPVRDYTLRDGDRLQVGSCSVLEFRAVADHAELEALERYRAALRDGDTGAFNRAHFLWRLREEYGHARRRREPLSVVMLGPDRLEETRALHGQGAGQALLARLAEVVSRELRDDDILARFEHDTFAVVLRGQSGRRASQAAERLRQTVRSTPFSCAGRLLSVSLSCGIATYRMENFDEPRQLVQEAAEGLFEARRDGGDACIGPAAGQDPAD